jgi:rhodanese-related sulfurtransferase
VLHSTAQYRTAAEQAVQCRAQQVDDVDVRYDRRTTVFHSDDVQPAVVSTELPAGVYLLDVREDDEWAAGHAPDAVHIPVGALSERAGEIPQDREIYVICRSGARSAYAAQTLAGSGWKTINVSDGMTGWAVAERPMVSETGAEPYVA